MPEETSMPTHLKIEPTDQLSSIFIMESVPCTPKKTTCQAHATQKPWQQIRLLQRISSSVENRSVILPKT